MAKVRQMRHDIASLLQKGQEATARIRVLIISKVSSFFILVYQVLLELVAILSTRKILSLEACIPSSYRTPLFFCYGTFDCATRFVLMVREIVWD